MDIRAATLKIPNLIGFYQLLEKRDWENLIMWHRQWTPWLTEATIAQVILEYKYALDELEIEIPN